MKEDVVAFFIGLMVGALFIVMTVVLIDPKMEGREEVRWKAIERGYAEISCPQKQKNVNLSGNNPPLLE